MSFFNPFRSTPAKGTPTQGVGQYSERAAGKDQSRAGIPLELISYDTQTEKFQLGQEALQVLRSVRLSSEASFQARNHSLRDSCRE